MTSSEHRPQFQVGFSCSRSHQQQKALLNLSACFAEHGVRHKRGKLLRLCMSMGMNCYNAFMSVGLTATLSVRQRFGTFQG